MIYQMNDLFGLIDLIFETLWSQKSQVILTLFFLSQIPRTVHFPPEILAEEKNCGQKYTSHLM